MSRKITVQFEVREMLIMKDTLEQMGISFTESAGQLRIEGSYGGISITDSNISFDSVDQKRVNKIKQQYMTNFYRDKAIKEGMQIHEEVNAKGEVILTLTNS